MSNLITPPPLKEIRQNTAFFHAYESAHPFHEIIARRIGCSHSFKTSKRISAFFRLLYTLHKKYKYKLYLVEGKDLRFPLAKYLGLIQAKLLFIVADGSPYKMVFEKSKNPFKNLIKRHLLRKTDGFICVSDMDRRLIKIVYPDARCIVVNQYIWNAKNKTTLLRLNNQLPNLKSHKIILISNAEHDYRYKGIDLVVKAFIKSKEKINNLELYFIGTYGNEIQRKFSQMDKDIKFIGRVPNIIKEFKKYALCVHMGRGDDFPISTIESSCAGLPTIVSEWTGTKDAIKRINKNLVVKCNADSLSKRILWYFDLAYKNKVKLSKTATLKTLSFLDGNKILSKFGENYKRLLKEIKI